MTTHLPPKEPMEPDDALPGEAELLALYRQLPQSEPSSALDAAVLRAAASAVAIDKPQGELRAQADGSTATFAMPTNASATVTPIAAARSRKAPPRWLLGFASAAMLVLVAGVAWQLRDAPENAPVAADNAGYPSAAPAASPVAPSARDSVPMPQAATAVVATQESLPTPAVHQTEPAKLRARTIDSSIAYNALRKPPHVTAEATVAVRQSRIAKVPPPINEISAAAPVVSDSHEAYTSAQASPSPIANPQNAFTKAGSNDVALSDKIIAPPATPPAPSPALPATAPVVMDAPSAVAQTAMTAPSRKPFVVAARTSAPMPMPMPMPAAAAPPTPPPVAAPTDTTKRPSDTPAQELAKITALFAQRTDDAEAQRRLVQFRRDHPAWQLDPSLRARLGEP